jgi:monofunctional biosynthetic peptidoglycan transglycosylase
MAWNWIRAKVIMQPYSRPAFHWRAMKDISPHMVRAVMAGEDQRFLNHYGFDFIELKWALRDLLSIRRLRGASTISMQAARTVFLWPERSWSRKVAEAYYTLLIEIMWSKRRIMEVYLNTVDWGPGIMGVDAASRKYFRRPSDEVTPGQSALLAAILPNPHRWSPNNPNPYVRERQKKILQDMKKMPRL